MRIAPSTQAEKFKSLRAAASFARSAIDGRILMDSEDFFSVRYDIHSLPLGCTCPDKPRVCPAFLWIVIVT